MSATSKPNTSLCSTARTSNEPHPSTTTPTSSESWPNPSFRKTIMPANNGAESNKRKSTVVGGGISGLAAAYEIQRQAREENLPVTVTLIEAENRLGGKILTENIDGSTVEGGPDCFIRQKPYAANLSSAVGLKDELIGTNDDKRKTYVVNNGKLTPLPEGVMLIIPTKIKPFVTSSLFTWPGKIRMGMDFFIPPFKGSDDETVSRFVRRRLGDEALEKLAEPLLSGIHVSDPETQSLLATFPRFREMEQKHGNLIKGMLAERKLAAKHRPNGSKPASIFQSLRGGLGQLPAALDGYRLILDNGLTIDSDAVILAIPSYQAAALLQPLSQKAATALYTIKYVSTATISLGYLKTD